MAPSFNSLVSVAALVVCAFADPLDFTSDMLPSDEACDAEDPECALSLAQLRASRHHQEQVTAPADADSVKEALESRRESSGDDHLGLGSSSLVDTLQTKSRYMTGYHQTSPEFCNSILAGGFHPGHYGWCGGAMYFALSPQATYTKAVGVESHLGCMLKVKLDMGKAATDYGRRCDESMNGHKLKSRGYDSIIYNPGDGAELVVYDPRRILKVEKMWSKGDGDAPNDAYQLQRAHRARQDTINELKRRR